jgi:antitoxin (DNA-binding transcriptional repressor) of toxin-antitoxin stability system
MKFITVRDLRTKTAQIWKQLPVEQEMVVTSNGRPIALLTPMGEDNLEDSLRAIRRARAAVAVDRMQQESMKTGRNLLSAEDIDEEIQKVRNHSES